jgi:hydrogenase expression/formation protein HypE
MTDDQSKFELSCPIPKQKFSTIQMAHGGGGRQMRDLIEGIFRPAFTPKGTKPGISHDASLLEITTAKGASATIAMTTDTFVVNPVFFPGGDIGHLAVCGTVNDLAVSGARPLALSAGFILEEGFPIESLEKICASIAQACAEAGVSIITGDTKVVDRGKADGIYINTAGIGLVPEGVRIHPTEVRSGDAVIVSGDLGRHGMAIMSVREGLSFGGDLKSDCASLVELCEKLLQAVPETHCLRDLTRGGLASALCEIATDASVGVQLIETSIPVIPPVASACELLGLDPLYVANEGRLVAIVPPDKAEAALTQIQSLSVGEGAAIVGHLTDKDPGTVVLKNALGTSRILDLLSGEQMPRIC